MGTTLLLAAPAAAAPPTFSGQTPFGAGDLPVAVTAADLNADGRPDLATADLTTNGAGGNTVLINATAAGAGTPSFTGPTPFAARLNPFSIAAADVDGDGRPDLVTANAGEPAAGGVSVLRNTTSAGATVPAFDGPTLFVGARRRDG